MFLVACQLYTGSRYTSTAADDGLSGSEEEDGALGGSAEAAADAAGMFVAADEAAVTAPAATVL